MNLKQLSEKLGLSQTTVSRALNGYPEVAEATRLKIQQAARLHNYVPNARAKSLATGRAMAVGHVIPLSAQHEIVNPVFADFIAGASETYLEHGYDMMLSLVPDDAEESAYRALAARASVDGIILHGPRIGDTRAALLREIGLPFVVHGRMSRAQADYDWVDVNNLRSFRRATDFLLDLGHRRIALVNGLLALDFAERRQRGYLEALAGRGVPADPALIHSDEMTEGYGYRTARALLAAPAPPTAFLCASLISALGVRRAVEERGLTMGREVSVITHDDELSYLANGSEGEVPPFTATRSSVRQAGRLCARRVLELVADSGQPPRPTLLEAHLTVGRSTGPAPS